MMKLDKAVISVSLKQKTQQHMKTNTCGEPGVDAEPDKTANDLQRRAAHVSALQQRSRFKKETETFRSLLKDASAGVSHIINIPFLVFLCEDATTSSKHQ